MSLKRRDLIEIERLTGKPAGKLFPGGVATAEGMLALQYLDDVRGGATQAPFGDWLDEDLNVAPDGAEVAEGETPEADPDPQ